jgi:hypothetical protein
VRIIVIRLVIAMAFLLLAVPPAAEAQRTRKIPRVGIVAATSAAAARHQVDAFRGVSGSWGTSKGRAS